jgi:hypothetical protein
MLWLIPGRSIAFLFCDKRKKEKGIALAAVAKPTGCHCDFGKAAGQLRSR